MHFGGPSILVWFSSKTENNKNCSICIPIHFNTATAYRCARSSFVFGLSDSLLFFPTTHIASIQNATKQNSRHFEVRISVYRVIDEIFVFGSLAAHTNVFVIVSFAGRLCLCRFKGRHRFIQSSKVPLVCIGRHFGLRVFDVFFDLFTFIFARFKSALQQ